MFNAQFGWLMLLGAAVLWPIRRGVVRARLGRVTPEWMEWEVIQAEVMLEGFMALGFISLLGTLFGDVMPVPVPGYDIFVSVALHALAAGSVAAVIETVRRPGFVSRFVLILLGVAWVVACALAVLTAYQPIQANDITRGAPVAILLGLAAYGLSWWRLVRE